MFTESQRCGVGHSGMFLDQFLVFFFNVLVYEDSLPPVATWLRLWHKCRSNNVVKRFMAKTEEIN